MSGDARDQLRARATDSDREIGRGAEHMAAQVETELPVAASVIDGTAADATREVKRDATAAVAEIGEHVGRTARQLADAGTVAAETARTRAAQDRARLLDAATASAHTLRERVQEAATAAHGQLAEIAGRAAALPLDKGAATTATGEAQAVIGAEFDTATSGLAGVSGAVGAQLTGAAEQSRAVLAEVPERAGALLSQAATGTAGELANGASRTTDGLRTAVSGVTAAGTSAIAMAGQRLGGAVTQARSGLTEAAGTARRDLSEPAEEARANTEAALTGVGDRILRGQQQVTDRGAALQRTTQRVVQRSILGDIGDWFARQWDDIKNMLGNWGFWAGLVVTLVLFPALGPGAFVVGGLVGGAVSGIQQNVKQGRDWYDLRNIATGAAVGALVGGAFALGSAGLVLFGLEGAALVAGEMVLAGGIGAILNIINGDPWDKGLLGNILLVGLFRGIGRAFGRSFGGGRPPVEEAPPSGGRPGTRVPGERAPVPDEGDGCFTPGTLVLTPDGPVPIKAIAVGDKVLGADPDGESSPQLVTAVMTHTVPRILDLTVDGQVITCSPEHPFWVAGTDWTPAGALTTGAVLSTVDGRAVTVTRVAAYPEGAWRVLNLTVAGTHTYFVSNAGVLVHNKARRYRPPSAELEPARAGELAELETLKTRARQARQGAESMPEGPAREEAIRQARELERDITDLQVDADGAQSVDDVREVTAARETAEARVTDLERRVPQAPRPSEESPPGVEPAETFSTVEAAIGQVEGTARVVQTVPTENANLRAQGFTETVYVVDNNGTQWTVHHNPRTGRYFGAHHSSSN